MNWNDIIGPILNTTEGGKLKEKIINERKLKPVLPEPEKMFNAFKECPYDKLKIVILGQDPYPNKIDANGIAFSTNNNKIPASLKNIFLELHRSLYNYMPLDEFKKYFRTGDLTKWANQGVLLLNSALTVVEHEPGSHENIGWDYFVGNILKRISNDYPKPVVFIFWGNKAKSFVKYIDKDKHGVFTAVHPEAEVHNSGSFIGNNTFAYAIDYLEKKRDVKESFDDESPIFDLNNVIDKNQIYDYIIKWFSEKGVIAPIWINGIENPLLPENKNKFLSTIEKALRIKLASTIDFRLTNT